MKIELRPWRLADAPALAGLINNKKVQDNLRDGLPFPYTTAHAEQFLAQVLDACPNDVFARAIVAEGAVVGSLTAERQKNIHRYTAELGYYIGEPYWGRGITTAAVSRPAPGFLPTPIWCAFTPNPSRATALPAGCWKKPGSRWRAGCARTP